MVNKPKQTGTKAETAVLKQIRPYFPGADRRTQKGANDEGDIGYCGDFIFEVKGGAQTKQIGDGKLAKWMEEAEREAKHAGVTYGILVTQRAGFGLPNARRWWTYVRLEDFAEICGGYYKPGRFATIRLELGDFLDLISDQGFVPNVSTDTDSVLVVDEAVASHMAEHIKYLEEAVPMIDWLADSAADRLDEDLDAEHA